MTPRSGGGSRQKLMDFRRALRPFSEDDEKPERPFAVCDIETRDWIHFLVIGFFDGRNFAEFRTIEEFLSFVLGRCEDPDFPRQIFAHFGGKFDFLFLLRTCFELHEELRVENLIPRGSGLLCFDVVKVIEGEEMRVTFTDSAALLPFGLENLTRSFQVEHKKLDWDHSKTRRVTRKLLEYLEHDCRGLYQVLLKYRKWDLISRVGSRTTMASQALQVFRLYLDKPIVSLGDRADEFVRKSYFGGRTEIFKPLYLGKKPLFCYDVNSLYPFSMLGDFPNRPRLFTDQYRGDEMGFYDVTVTVPKELWIPPLGSVLQVGKTEKFIFPTGTFRGSWSTLDLEYAKSLGVRIEKVHRGILFRSGGGIFKEYIEHLYQLRLTAKANKDSVGDVLTKLLMNSLYGRMGLNRERENLVLLPGPDAELYTEIETARGVVRLFTEGKTLENSFSNVAIAAWVTSRARVYMHQIYRECAQDLYYTDTDSLFTTREMETGDGLGKLKLEYEAGPSCFLLPKTYYATVPKGIQKKDGTLDHFKVVMKGFEQKKCRDFTLEDFMNGLEGDLRGLKASFSPRIATLKKALMKRKLVMMMPKTERAIRSAYDKRRIIRLSSQEYTSRPLDAQLDLGLSG